MAVNNSERQQRQTTFQIIQPLFNDEFNTQDPIFEDWILERMTRNVNVKRIIWDGYKTSRGWRYESYNTKGRFRCIKCIKAGVTEHDATWSSDYTTVLFRAYPVLDTDESGQMWIYGGWIQMKTFAQQCTKCDEYITGELENDGPRNLVRWLHRWIANIFYGYPSYRSSYRGRKTDKNHLVNRCEACIAGWCSYRKVDEYRN